MLKDEKLKQFMNQHVLPLHEEALNKLVSDIRIHIEDLKKKARDSIINACKNTIELQKEGEVGSIAYMIVTMLRTELYARQYSYKVKVYNKQWYFDDGQTDVETVDVSFYYQYMDELWDELYDVRKSFIKIVTDNDVDNIMQILCTQYHDFVLYIYNLAIKEMDIASIAAGLQREPNFKILVGEYVDKTIIVFDETPEEAEKSLV